MEFVILSLKINAPVKYTPHHTLLKKHLLTDCSLLLLPNHTMSATLTYKGDSAGTVQAAGEFSNWQPVDMKYVDDEWLLILDGLDVGKAYQYKFIINGQWGLDPNAASVDDGNGNLNHSVTAVEKPAPREEKATEPEPPSTTAAPIDAVATPTQTTTAPEPTVSEPEPKATPPQTQSAPATTSAAKISEPQISSDKSTPVTQVSTEAKPAAPAITAAPTADEQQPSAPNPVTAEKQPGPGKTSTSQTESSNKDSDAVTSPPTTTTTTSGSNTTSTTQSDQTAASAQAPAPEARPAASAPAATGASGSSSGAAKTLRGDGSTPQKKRGFFKRLFG